MTTHRRLASILRGIARICAVRRLRGVLSLLLLAAVAAPAFAQDQDQDGISDADEVMIWSTNPSLSDTDLDGWDDGVEVLVTGSSPSLADTDGDGTNDPADASPTHYNGSTYGGGTNATFANARTGFLGAASGLSPYDGVGVLLVEGSLQFDLSVANAKGIRGVDHALSLHYDSQSLYDGRFGIGWTSILDTKRTVDGSGNTTLYLNGQSFTFTCLGPNTYDPPAELAGWTLTLESGVYTLTSPRGQQIAVSSSGVESVADRFGNTITYNRTGGVLSSVTDSRGESHTLELYSTGRFKKITLADGAAWEFRYNSKDQLWKILGPATTSFSSGISYEFRYSQGASSASLNSNMVAAMNGRGTWWLRNVYDGSDRVVRQVVPASNHFDFDYANAFAEEVTVTDRAGNERVWTWDATKLTKESLVEKTNRSVRSGEGDYTTTWTTDSEGFLVEVEYPRGNGVEYDLNAVKLPTEVRRKTNVSAAADTTDLVDTYAYDSGAFYGLTSHTDSLGSETTYDLDAKGQPELVTFPELTHVSPSVTVTQETTYNLDGTVSTFTDGEGHVTAYAYFPSGPKKGRLSSKVVDQGGLDLTTTYDYEDWGDLKSVTDPRGFTTTYTVERYGNVEVVEGPSALGYVTQYDHDGNLNVVQKRVKNIDFDGTWLSSPQWWTTSYGWTAMDKIETVQEAIDGSTNRETFLYYDANDNLSEVFREGRRTLMTYDERDLLYQRSRVGETTTPTEEFTYDENRNLVSHENARGKVTTTEWDYFDRPVKTIDPLGHYAEQIYDELGHVTEQKRWEEAGATDVLLAHHKNTFDAMGRQWKEEDALLGGSTTWYARTVVYDKDGQVVAATDRRSEESTATFDGAHRRISATDPLGNLTEWEHDENGNVTAIDETEKIPGSSSTETYRTEMEFDAINRLTKRTEIDRTNSSNTKVTEWKRSAIGLRRTIDPKGNQVTLALDGLGRTTEKSEDMGSSAAIVTQWTWNEHDEVTRLRDDNSHDTDYEFNQLGQLITKTYESTKTVRFEYDLGGNVERIEDQIGTLIDLGYDDLDRVVGRSVTLGSGVGGDTDASFAFDALGRLTEAADDDSVVQLTYDSLSRVLTEVQGSNPLGTTGKTVTYSWDAESNRTEVGYPSGFEAHETRDALGRMTLIEDQTTADIASFALYGAGQRRKTQTLQNGSQGFFTYDGFRRPTEIAHKTGGGSQFAGFTYAWDKNDNPLMEQRSHTSDKGDVYTYDKANRLTRVLRDVDDPVAELATPNSEAYVNRLEYDMDDVFNLTAYKVTPYGGSTTTTSYTTDAMNQYTAVGATSPTYTDAGSLASDGTFTYKYDAHQHLIEVKQGATVIATYQYDALGLGRRIGKVVGGSATTRYVHAGQQAVEEHDGTGSGANLRRLYVFGDTIDQVVMMEAPDAADVDSDANTSEVLRFSYHAQLIGSVTQVTGPAQTVVESYLYDPYGKPTIKDAGGSTISASAIGNAYLFTGRQLDEETGLYYYRARHYSAELRRFIQRDPLEYVNGPSAFAYVVCAPSREVDPLGLQVPEGGGVPQDTVGAVPGVPSGETGEPVSPQNEPHDGEYNEAASNEMGSAKSWSEGPTIEQAYGACVAVRWIGYLWQVKSKGTGSDAAGRYVFVRWDVYFCGRIIYMFIENGKRVPRTLSRNKLWLKKVVIKKYLKPAPSAGGPPVSPGGPGVGPRSPGSTGKGGGDTGPPPTPGGPEFSGPDTPTEPPTPGERGQDRDAPPGPSPWASVGLLGTSAWSSLR